MTDAPSQLVMPEICVPDQLQPLSRMHATLTSLLNTDPFLHSILWTTGEMEPSILAVAQPGASEGTPRPLDVTLVPGYPLSENNLGAEAGVIDITSVNLESNLMGDGRLNIGLHLQGICATDLSSEDTPLDLILSNPLGAAAREWLDGSGGELRFHGGPVEDDPDVTVICIRPLDDRSQVTFRAYAVPVLIARQVMSGLTPAESQLSADASRINIHARYLPDLVQGAEAIELALGGNAEERREASARSRLQRDLFLMQQEQVRRTDRSITAAVDYGQPWGGVAFAPDVAFPVLRAVPSTFTAEPRWSPDAASLTADVRGLPLGPGLADPVELLVLSGGVRTVSVHPEACLLLLRALQELPRVTLDIDVTFEPRRSADIVHPWQAFGLRDGEVSQLRFCISPDQPTLLIRTQGNQVGGTVPIEGLMPLLNRVCRQYLNDDLPRWQATRTGRS